LLQLGGLGGIDKRERPARREGTGAPRAGGGRATRLGPLRPPGPRCQVLGRTGFEEAAVIYGEPETPRFLVALERLKRQQRKKERQTRQAKQRVRAYLRKLRAC